MIQEPKVTFEYSKFFNTITMIIKDEKGLPLFYENVTHDVLKIVETYKENN